MVVRQDLAVGCEHDAGACRGGLLIAKRGHHVDQPWVHPGRNLAGGQRGPGGGGGHGHRGRVQAADQSARGGSRHQGSSAGDDQAALVVPARRRRRFGDEAVSSAITRYTRITGSARRVPVRRDSPGRSGAVLTRSGRRSGSWVLPSTPCRMAASSLSLRSDNRFRTLRGAKGSRLLSSKFPEGLLKTFRFTGSRPAPSRPAPSQPSSGASAPVSHSRTASLTRAGTRSLDRRTSQAVPLVAIQPTSASLVGGGLDGSGSGPGPTGYPDAASRAWKRQAMRRWPRSFGCSRSTLQ